MKMLPYTGLHYSGLTRNDFEKLCRDYSEEAEVMNTDFLRTYLENYEASLNMFKKFLRKFDPENCEPLRIRVYKCVLESKLNSGKN